MNEKILTREFSRYIFKDDFKRISYHRLNKHYQDPHELCKLILDKINEIGIPIYTIDISGKILSKDFDCVAVELCPARYENLKNRSWWKKRLL